MIATSCTSNVCGFIVGLSLAAASALGLGNEQGAAGATRPDQANGSTMQVAGLVGPVVAASRGGDSRVLETGDSLQFGDTIRTDEASRAAIRIAGSSSTSPDQTDLLLVGPSSAVRFVRERVAEKVTTGTRPPEVVVVDVLDGTYRLVIRSMSGTSACKIRVGGVTVDLEGAMIAGTYDAASEAATFLLGEGSAVFQAGERTPRLSSKMIRRADGGRILAATHYTDEQWDGIVAATTVPGVKVRRPRPAGSGAAATTAASAPTPAARKPATEPEPAAAEPDTSGNEGQERTSGTETQAGAAASDLVYVRMTTSMGVIDLELDRGKAPISVGNFLEYVHEEFYEGTIFHRVIDGFMIQGGGFTEAMIRKPTRAPIKNEWENGLKHRRGTIAMARMGRQVDSATSQFFINVVDNARLDRPQPDGAGYAVFGRVVSGMDIVDAIRAVETKSHRSARGPMHNVPVEPVVIEKVEMLTEAPGR